MKIFASILCLTFCGKGERNFFSKHCTRWFAALSGQMKPPQCCFQHWCEVQLQSRTGHNHIPHAVAGHLPLQSHICKKEIAITDSLFRFRWVNKSGANYMTILSSFSASFPPHYDTISWQLTVMRFTHMQKHDKLMVKLFLLWYIYIYNCKNWIVISASHLLSGFQMSEHMHWQ